MKNQQINEKDCLRKEDLITYLYGECTPAEERSFKQHLPECSSCQREMVEFGVARESLQNWQIPPSPRVVLDLAAERPRTLRAILAELAAALPGWFKYTAAAASACALALVFFAGLNTQISYGKEGFNIQLALFNKTDSQPANNNGFASEAAAREMVAKMISEKESQMEQQLEQKRVQLEQQLNKQINLLTSELSEKSSSQLSRASLELKKQHREELQRALFELQRQRRRNDSNFDDDPFSLFGGIDGREERNLRSRQSDFSAGGN